MQEHDRLRVLAELDQLEVVGPAKAPVRKPRPLAVIGASSHPKAVTPRRAGRTSAAGAPWYGVSLIAGAFLVLGAILSQTASWLLAGKERAFTVEQRWDQPRLAAYAEFLERAAE